MMFPTDSVADCVTVFAGTGKGCGKTAAFGAVAMIARELGPVALFTIGFDTAGAAMPKPSHATEPPALRVGQGDVVITTIPLARAAGTRLEVLDALPGRSAIGRLCVCRAVRAGSVSLVGPETFDQLASAIDLVRRDSLTESVLVDGAANRMTQVAALPDAQVVYCAKADASNYLRVAESIELVSRLADLPLEEEGETDGRGGEGCLRLEGPLTSSVLDGLGKDTTHVSIGCLSDCFLDAQSFGRASRRMKITVRRRIPLLCFVIALKDMEPSTFLAAAPSAAGRAVFDLYGALPKNYSASTF